MLHVSASVKDSIQTIFLNAQIITKRSLITLLLIINLLIITSFLKAQDTFLGLTSNGGPDGRGTAFSIKNNGNNFSITHAFADFGKNPNGDLIQGDDGDFYGMTIYGGTYTYGSIFKVTSAGVITILHQFNSAIDGANPYGELTKGNDGNFYGTTSSGGTHSNGTIFKITPTGTFTVITHLTSATDGSNPRGHLVLAPDGNFYGCTYAGGAFGYGTIFKVTATGTLTVLHSLSSAADGANCYGSLVRG
ncbi:MAG: choice-of-anchor tandem repeat GloVer-containing protein, partial [Parafilimonas sp.]